MRQKGSHLRVVGRGSGKPPSKWNSRLRAKFTLWWNGGEPPPPNVVSGEWAQAYLAMRASLRRSWVFMAVFGILVLLIAGLVSADPYWPVFLIFFVLIWFILPRIEEPALFFWYASILGWLILYNVLAQLVSLPILVRVFWAAIALAQGYGIYTNIRAYQQFRVFYSLKDTRSREYVVSRLLTWGWAVGGALAIVALVIFVVADLQGEVGLLQLSLARYISAVAPAFAIASLGTPAVRKPWAIAGVVSTLIVTLGLYSLIAYATLTT